MPHHLFAYSGSVAQNAVLAYVPTITDEILTPFSAQVYTWQRDTKLLRGYAFGDSMSQVQIDTPILRLIGPPQINPFETAAAPGNLPPINKWDESALTWTNQDPMGVQVSRAGAGAAVCQILFWTASVFQTPMPGPVRSVRCTSAVVSSNAGWVSGPLVFSQQLPTGRYSVRGMAVYGTNVFAARIIFPGQVERPGVLAQQANGEYEHEWFRYGNFGEFGQFMSFAPPTIQILGYGATTTQTVWLDLVPVSLGTTSPAVGF